MPMSLIEARALYDSGAPVTAVAAALGLKADAFRRLRKQHNWPLRSSPIRQGASAKGKGATAKGKRADTATRKPKPKAAARKRVLAPSPSNIDPPPPADGGQRQVNPQANPQVNLQVDLPAFRRQVESAAQRELAKVQKTLASGKTEDVERNARLLASLVKSLAELRRLEALDPLSGASASAVEGLDDERPPRDLETLRDELARALERMSGEPGGPDAGR